MTSTASAQSANCSASTAGESQLNETGFTASSPTPSTATGAQDPITNDINGNDAAGRFTTGAAEASGDTYVVDLGSSQTFNEIEMADPDYTSDYAYGYEVEVSTNGTTWTTSC